MPIGNLGFKHITPEQIIEFDKGIAMAMAVITAVTQNLTNEERTRFGKIQERNKLLANSAQDYHDIQPDLSSPDVDWAEFVLDYADRKFAATRGDRVDSLRRMLSDFKIVHDYDNYQAALTDYNYTKYKSTTNTPGFTEKYADQKQYFANTGGGSKTNSTISNINSANNEQGQGIMNSEK